MAFVEHDQPKIGERVGLGVLPDGAVPKGIEAQAEACWRNIIAVLADAGMGVGDLVKITTYLVRPEDVAPPARRGQNT